MLASADDASSDPPAYRRRRLAFFCTWCPAGTDIATFVSVEGHRWVIEDSFETAKMSLGSITTRPAPGMAGAAMFRSSCSPLPRWPQSAIAPIRRRTSKRYFCGPPLIRWSIQEIRCIANRLAQRRIPKAHLVAWSLWRRAHQAATKRAPFRLKQKCNCNVGRGREAARLNNPHSFDN
jgi:hypothetical protein